MEAWFGKWGAKQVEVDAVTPPATALYDLPHLKRNKTESHPRSPPTRSPRFTRATSATTASDQVPTINFTESVSEAPLGKSSVPAKKTLCEALDEDTGVSSEDEIFRDTPEINTDTDNFSEAETPPPLRSETSAKKTYVLDYDIPVSPTPGSMSLGPVPELLEEVPLEKAAELASFELQTGQIIEIGEPGQTNTITWTCTDPDGAVRTHECTITVGVPPMSIFDFLHQGRAQLSVSF